MKILIAEDEFDSRLIVAAMLKAGGHEVLEAENGREALLAARSEKPDLVISDVLMPVMDGYKLCEQIKRDCTLRHIPFIFYTATFREPQDEQLGLGLGASRYLVKPVDPANLLKIIDEVLGEAVPIFESAATAPAETAGMYTDSLAVKLEKKVVQLEEEIARRKKAELALHAAHRRLITVMDSLDAIVYVADLETHELLCMNKLARQIFGDGTGNKCWQVLQNGQEGPCEFCSNKFLLDEEGKPRGLHHWELRNTRNGRWYDMRDRAIRWQDGRLVRLEIATDISDRKQMEEKLQERIDERTRMLDLAFRQLLHAEKLSAIGRLSASFAHEFNSPLFAVTNVIERLRGKATLDSRDIRLVGMAYEECLRMHRLTSNLQDFHRPSSGKKEPVRLDKVLRDVLLVLHKKFIEQQIQVVEALDPDIPEIEVIPDQIKQVFLNLLQNAAEACRAGDSITVSLGIRKENLLVRIADTGKGIAPEDLQHVFEPFFTTKTKVSGTGLGLSVSHGIIMSHGGRIEVVSEPGNGSTFSVFLPIEGGEKNGWTARSAG